MTHATHAAPTPPRRSKSAPSISALDALLDPALRETFRRGSELQKAAFARLINLSREIRAIEAAALQNALAASDPSTFLVRLAQEIVQPTTSPYPHYDAAIRRGIELRNRILQEDGGIVTAKEAAALLGLTTPQAIYNQVRRHMLLAVPAGARGMCLPAWQFKAGHALPGLSLVLQALPGSDPWWNLLFFVSTNPGLGNRRPLDALNNGEVDAVVRAARAHGQGGR